MIINKIFIDNIKGIDHFEFSQDLYPNRPNILVAPNGYGKSSFATAFLSAQNGPIVLKPEECHNEDINNNQMVKPLLPIKIQIRLLMNITFMLLITSLFRMQRQNILDNVLMQRQIWILNLHI